MIDDLTMWSRIYMVSLLDSVSQTDDIQDVSARTVGGKVTFLRLIVRPLQPPPPPATDLTSAFEEA